MAAPAGDEPEPTAESRLITSRFVLSYGRAALVTYAGLCAVLLAFVSLPLPYLAELQASNLEMLVRLKQVIRPPPFCRDLLLLEVDGDAERVAGAWPFARDKLALVVRRLAQEKARVVVLDCLFGDRELRDLADDDPLGRAIVAAGNVVLPSRPGAHGADSRRARIDRAILGEGLAEIAPIDELFFQRVRFCRLEPDGSRHDSWHLAAIRSFLSRSLGRDVPVEVAGNKVRLGDLSFAAPGGWFRVDPGMATSFATDSLAKVLMDPISIDRGKIEGKLVVVSVRTASSVPVPVTPDLSAVPGRVDALALAGALTGHTIRRPPFLVDLALAFLTFLYTVQICYAVRSRRAIMVTKVGVTLTLIPLAGLMWFNVELDVARAIVVFLVALPITMAFRWFEFRKPAPEPTAGPAAGAAPDQEAPVESSGDDDSVLDELVRQHLSDRFQRVQLVGSGGMGMVFRVHSVKLRADVALKVLHPQHVKRRGAVDRFFREYEIGQKLSHPAFVRVFESGRGKLCWFSMEFVRGRSLRERLSDDPPPMWTEVVTVFREILGALAYAHSVGILHRDLKPENVMLLDSGGVKVLDLGVARIEEASSLTATGEVLGTLRYMSPEQIDGVGPDARADLFAAGVMLFELLTGAMPYGPTNFTRKVDDLESRLGQVAPRPPEALIALVRDLMEVDRDRRVPTAMAALERLEAIPAEPPTLD